MHQYLRLHTTSLSQRMTIVMLITVLPNMPVMLNTLALLNMAAGILYTPPPSSGGLHWSPDDFR